MRITHLRLQNWLKHHHLDLPLSPLTMIAGPNGAGKSSIRDAIDFAFRGAADRIESKADRPLLLTAGSQSGSVSITCGDVTLTRDITTGKAAAAALPIPDDACRMAAPYLLSPARFAEASADERRELLLSVMRVDLSLPALRKALAARGCTAALIAQLDPAADLDGWRKQAERGAAEARGAWKAITGETYGPKKADGCHRPPPEPASAEDLAATEALVARLDGEHADALREATRLEAAEEAQRGLAALRQAAEKAAEASDIVADLEGQLAVAKRQVARAQQAVADAEAAAPTASQKCPLCAGALAVEAARIVIHTPNPRASTQQERAEASSNLGKAEAEVMLLEAQLRKARPEAERAAAAVEALDAMPPAPPPGAATAAMERQRELRDGLTAARDRLRQQRDAQRAAEAAADATTKAAAAHAEVKGWTVIGGMLAPGGIPGETLGTALAPLNAALREAAAATGWPQVSVSAEMAITASGRGYRLLCESERWRADAMIAAALAWLSGLKFLVIDRMDVLDLPSRPGLLRWLYQLTMAGTLDTALVMGTLKAPPSAPAAVRVHWLGPLPALAAA